MRDDIYKEGIEHRFSSTNQPDPAKKRVPKLKTQLKRDLAKHYEAISKKIIEKSKDGSIKHIEFVRDWLYGKVKDELSLKANIMMQLNSMSEDEIDKRLKELNDKKPED